MVLALGSAALLARRAGGRDEDEKNAKNAHARNPSVDAVVKTAVRADVRAFEVVPNVEVDYDEKNLIDGWLFAKRDEVNMFGDARGTKYEHGTPLRDADGGRTNDKYAYIVKKNPSKPWVARFPKHWGKEPTVETKDYVKLPEEYGFGSSTLRAWIEENLARDATTEAEEVAAAESPVVTPADSLVVAPEFKSRVEVVEEAVETVEAAVEKVAAEESSADAPTEDAPTEDAPTEDAITPTKPVAAPAVEEEAEASPK